MAATEGAVREGAPAVDPLAPVSLLWPPGHVPSPGPARITGPTLADLDLRELILVLAGHDSKREAFVTALLQELGDPEQTRYRQEVTEALLADERLARAMLDAAATLQDIHQLRAGSGRVTWSVSIVAKRVLELEAYVRLATHLRDDLARAPRALERSRALALLHAHLGALTGTPAFTALQQELPVVRATLDRVRSVTVGINLTRDLNPDSATILSIDATRVEGRGPLLDRLFGRGSAERALSPLHNVDLTNPGNPLSRDLQKLLAAVVQPVSDAMGRHTHVNAQSLDHLEREIHFYLNAVSLVGKLEHAGLPTCLAELAPPDARLTRMTEAYNIGLALRTLGETPTGPDGDTARPVVDGNALGIVTNAVTFDDALGRVWILTGPNRGGKTTFTRSVGQAHVMVQAGLRAPARTACLSPVGSIYTHFPTPESEQLGMGKLDEEAQRLAEVFRVATPHSLILLNEVLAGTSAIEALGLAVDAVRALRLLGARAIYTTHLHELPTKCAEINDTTPGRSLVGSLVAGVDQSASPPGQSRHPAGVISGGHRRTFRIQPGPPQNVSYASEIAEQHGISFPQLQRLFQKRGLV